MGGQAWEECNKIFDTTSGYYYLILQLNTTSGYYYLILPLDTAAFNRTFVSFNDNMFNDENDDNAGVSKNKKIN